MAKGRTATSFDLPRPVSLPGQTRQEAAYRALRDAILEGLLAPGSAVPSSRSLAIRWEMARGTLEAVLDRLRVEGYIERRTGAGSRVQAALPEHYSTPAASAKAPQRQPGPGALPALAPSHAQVGVAFVARLANPALFDRQEWANCLQRALRQQPLESWSRAEPAGAQALREQVAQHLRRHRGIACTPNELLITHGIRHSADLVARCLLRLGDQVLVEDPGYPALHGIFERAGARLAYVPVDEHGLCTEHLANYPMARLACVTPAHQAPLGASLAAARRVALLAWAEHADGWVLEDDYDSEFNYRSAPLPALKAIDRHERVIHCGSFNQGLFANLRLGYLLAPAPVRDQVLALWQSVGRSAGVSEQWGLAAYMQSGAHQRHLRRARLACQGVRDVLLAALAEHGQGRLRVTGEQAGFHLTLWLPADCDTAALLAAAGARGLVLQSLSDLCRNLQLPPALILGYAALTQAQARESGRTLAKLIVACCRGGEAG